MSVPLYRLNHGTAIGDACRNPRGVLLLNLKEGIHRCMIDELRVLAGNGVHSTPNSLHLLIIPRS